MNDHTLINTNNIVTCEACAFRAIITNRGPFVREPGDAAVDHLSAIAVDLEWRRALVEQLRQRLVARLDGNAVLLNRLVKHIEAEYEG